MKRTKFPGRRRRMRVNGFTLMELLIVMAIITVLLLIAIPSYTNYIRFANETSGIKSVQIIKDAQVQYSTMFPTSGFACQLTALGGDPHSGPPSPTSAQILPPDLASGIKSGYQFTVSNCVKNAVNSDNSNGDNSGGRATGYTIIAQPLTVGKTGTRTFCSDESGIIKFDPTGGTNCTQPLTQ